MSKKIIGLLFSAVLIIGCSKTPDTVDQATFTFDSWELTKSTHFSINLRDIHFVNSKIGFVVGYNGDIYKTSNSGQTWTKQNSGTTLHLHSVSFLNENVGFASSSAMNCLDEDCNKGCLLLKTADGGKTWVKTFYPNFSSIRSLKFFDELNGIAIIYNAGNFDIPKQNIAITSDGGINWTLNDLEIFAPYDRLFFSGNVVFVAGEHQEIFKSVDFGHNWITINTPVLSSNSIRKLYFLNENIGLIDGITDIFKTIDGGTTWTKTNFPFNSFGTIHFSNENEGFNIEPVSSYEGGDFPGLTGSIFYETKDGGLTWTISEYIPNLVLNLADFPQRELGYGFSGSVHYRIKKLD